MATEVAEEPKAPTAAHETPSAAKGGGKNKLLIGGIVLTVIAVQVVATYLLMPHPASSEASHKSQHEQKGHDQHAPVASHESESEAAEGEVAEVPMGDFAFSNGRAAPGLIMHVDFKMVALTSSQRAASLDAQFKLHSARIRQAVNKIVRSSSLEELHDPNLGTIKRSVREEINRVLKKSYVNEVLITDFRIMEQ